MCLLIIAKFAPVKFGTDTINTQSFIHDKSSSTSQLIKGKSSGLQKLLRYLESPYWPGCSGLSSVFSVIFDLFINYLVLQISPPS